MSTPHHQAQTVEASRASMRRELARAGLSPGAGRTVQAAPTATGAKAGDPQANMRRQLARSGLQPDGRC